MANTNLINAYIRSSGYKMQHVAQTLEISSTALRNKLQGETQFKVDEAERLAAMLRLNMAQRDACFFDTQNHLERAMLFPPAEKEVR